MAPPSVKAAAGSICFVFFKLVSNEIKKWEILRLKHTRTQSSRVRNDCANQQRWERENKMHHFVVEIIFFVFNNKVIYIIKSLRLRRVLNVQFKISTARK